MRIHLAFAGLLILAGCSDDSSGAASTGGASGSAGAAADAAVAAQPEASPDTGSETSADQTAPPAVVACIEKPAPSGNGQYDSTFQNGARQIPLASGFSDPTVLGMRRDSQDRILVFGSASKSDSQTGFFVARFTASGEVDSSFGSAGGLSSTVGSNDDIPADLVADDQGAINLAGSSKVDDSTAKSFAVRITPQGSIDSTFAGSGAVLFSAGGPVSRASAMLPLPGGVLVAGYGLGTSYGAAKGAYLYKYLPTGVADATYPKVEEADVSFQSLAAAGSSLLLGGSGFVRKYSWDNVAAPDWSPEFLQHVERLFAHPKGGALVIGRGSFAGIDHKGLAVKEFPSYLSSFSAMTAAMYCDERVLVAGREFGAQGAPGVVRGTFNVGYELGSVEDGSKPWPGFETVAAGDWTMVDAVIQSDGKVVAGAEDGEGKIMLVRFAP